METGDLYEIGPQIGEGAHGRVYQVRERATGQHFAAKVMKYPITPEGRQRFDREARQLQHYEPLKTIMPVVRMYLDADPPFFIMPLASGNLEQWAGRMSVRQIAVAMLRVMDALAGVHADGGHHADIKPGNLLLVGGHTVVSDFGLANNPNVTQNFTQGAHGTLHYMAPELLRDPPAPFTSPCDVYSAGATWFHLITGRRPEVGVCPLNAMAVSPTCDKWMADWIAAMTRRDSAQRPTAVQVASALRQFVQPPVIQPVTAGAAGQSDPVKELLKLGAVVGAIALVIKLANEE